MAPPPSRANEALAASSDALMLPPPTRAQAFRAMALMLFFGGLYIGFSSALIAFNKYLMHLDRFPFAVNLVLLHAIVGSLVLGLLLLVKPSFFPSLTDPQSKVSLNWDLLGKGVMPVAALFCGQLVLSNLAYLHSSVAFLQMMKEANLVFVYILSLVVRLETFSCTQLQVLACVIIATAMTIHGELNFSLKGFAVQGTSQLFEASKIVLQALLLCPGGGKKLDALTYCVLVLPFCVLFNGLFLGACTLFIPNAHIPTASWADLAHWAPFLLANSLIAVMLNISVALFIKHSAAISYIFAGITKDAMIVTAGALFFKEIISSLQVVGFLLQMLLIFLWSLMKSFPRDFQDGVFLGVARVLFGYRKLADEVPDDAALAKATAAASSYGAVTKLAKPSEQCKATDV